MTYLELVRRLAREVGASGGIQSLQAVEGEAKRLADWVNQAWLEIQLVRDTWSWRLGEFEVSVPSGSSVVNTSTVVDFYKPLKGSVYGKFVAASTWFPLEYIDFQTWQDYVRARPTVISQPTSYTLKPDRTVELYPIPANDYSVRGLYVKKPQQLVNDFDVPILPEEFHQLIVYQAMMLYAQYEAAPEIFQAGVQGYNRLYSRMLNSEPFDVSLPGALA